MGLYSDSWKHAVREFGSRMRGGKRHLVRFLIEAAVFFAALYAMPWFGDIGDEAKLAAAVLGSVVLATSLEFLWDVILAPSAVYRLQCERVGAAEKNLSDLRSTRPSVQVHTAKRFNQKAFGGGQRYVLQVTNNGHPAQFSATLSVDGFPFSAFGSPQDRNVFPALWIDHRQPPYLNRGDAADIIVCDQENRHELKVYRRDLDGEAISLQSSVNRDRAYIRANVSITISTNPPTIEGPTVCAYAIHLRQRGDDAAAKYKLTIEPKGASPSFRSPPAPATETQP